MEPLTRYSFSDFSGGQADNLNLAITPESCADLGLNVVFDEEIGSAVSRLGTAIVGAQLVTGKSILGIGQHVDQSDPTKNILLACVNDASNTNSDIYDVVAGSKSLQDDTQGLKCRFLNYNGDTLRLNGTDAPKAYNSTSWLTTGGVFDLGNMPTGYKYAVVFLSRVYLWGNASHPYRLAYSGILANGTVSWTEGNGTIEIEPEDNGGAATGIGKVPGYVLLFKERSLHRWNFSSAFPEELVNIGTPSQESIVMAGGLCAFFSASNENDRGFFITNGGRPQPISHDCTRPIKKWIDAIPAANEANVAGWATNRGFAWSVGDLTVDGETYPNVVLYYNRILNQWSVRSYPSEFKCFAPYITGGVNTIVGGDDNGTVYRIDKAATYSDNGTAIRWKLRTRHEKYASNTIKDISDKIVVRGRNLGGLSVIGIPDEDITKAVSIDSNSVFRRLLALLNMGKTISGTTVAIEVTGETTNARACVQEIELLKIDHQLSHV